MSNGKVFCETCRNKTEYTASNTHMKASLKGKVYEYDGQEARCNICGSPVYVPKIIDANLESLYAEYRKDAGLISLEQIREIPKKYAIGKRPLSLLLGWGEVTYTRYMDGDVPTRQYSDILLRIYNEPQYYSDLLEAHKNRLPSQYTYKKSRAVVDVILNDGKAKEDPKINRVARYIIKKCGDISPLSLQKALFYAQGFYYAFYGTWLFDDEPILSEQGLVYEVPYNRFKNHQYGANETDDMQSVSNLSEAEKTVCGAVARYLCCYSGYVLNRFVSDDIAVLLQQNETSSSISVNSTVRKDWIKDLFCNIQKEYQMADVNDIQSFAKDRFAKLWQDVQ